MSREDGVSDDFVSDPFTGAKSDAGSGVEDSSVDGGSMEAGSDLGGGESLRGGLVAARGTVDGLVIRIDGRLESGAMRQALDEFVSARSSFLAGQEVFLEWVGARPEEEVEASLTQLLTRSYGILVKEVRLFSRPATSADSIGASAGGSLGSSFGIVAGSSGTPSSGEMPLSSPRRSGESLFGGVRSIETDSALDRRAGLPSKGMLGRGSGRADGAGHAGGSGSVVPGKLAVSPSGSAQARSFQSPLSGNFVPWDEPDSRLVHATLRSGQRLESEHSLVIVGDVNSGAEVVSGGDIVILGTLRGVAHAGAYEESGGGRVICALNMQPTQLRIGSVISRGGPADGKIAGGRFGEGRSAEGRAQDTRGTDGRVCPEVARVDGALIVVEPYQTKTLGKSASGLASTVGLLGRRRGAA